MNAYIRIGKSMYYEISDGKCISVSTERCAIKSVKTLPTGNIKDVKVITESEFNKVKNKIIEGI